MNLRQYMEAFGPLADPDLFETASLLMTTGLSGKARTKHLRSSLYKGKTPWKNNRALLKDIDRLPRGVEWVSDEIVIGEDSNERVYTVFKRDIVKVVGELIGAPRFKNHMRYAPERHWTSRNRRQRVYDEMWSGEWWWRTQDPYGTIVPLIIASDKTCLTRMSGGGQQAYPVYLTIGNISKSIRRKPTKHATTVIGYLPVDSFNDIPNIRTRQLYRGELLHRAMEKIVEPLKSTTNGVPMWCADSQLRRIYPILAAYVADSPEQFDVSCVVRSGCPICKQTYKGRGDGGCNAPFRDQTETLEAMREYRRTRKKRELDPLKLKPWWPFWADLPYVEFPSCLTPDLLHQIHKGLIKRHAMTWIEEFMGPKDFDARYTAMPTAKGMRHFKKGITTVSKWTGRESKEMAKQFLPVIIDPLIPNDVVKLIRALLDFTYLAHSARLTETELAAMVEALGTFHQLKNTMVEWEIVSPGAWDDMPIMHMVTHYSYSIRQLGTPDGYNTESPEYLHIPFVKEGWRASNKKNPIPQIVKYVGRMQAIRIHQTYLDELYPERTKPRERENIYNDDEDYEDDGNVNEKDDSCYESDDAEVELGPANTAVGAHIDSEDSGIAYPRPLLSIALQPTVPRVSGTTLVDTYGASDLMPALTRFLRPKCLAVGEDHYLLPTDRFDVWHKLTLHHDVLPFAPDEPAQRDVIRVKPPVRDHAGRLRDAGVFDVALVLDKPQAFGLKRYRAGRVRALFTLPRRLQHLHPGPLAYVELFAGFRPDQSATHAMYTTTRLGSLADGRRCAVVPIERISMACHLAPRFPNMEPIHTRGRKRTVPVFNPRNDLLCHSHQFFFNEFYNYFTYLFVMYWRYFYYENPTLP
ncbi:unnamed protein product [Rhizoctonia solani]|uniref:Uncharacterized protein n=2 Tax=Rhizoctonia solani TaxID=456999 RepID=A0A8H3BVP7_9AGAM